jgi:hypothetical protein
LVNLVAFVPRMVFPNAAAGCATARPWSRPQVPGIGYEIGLLIALLALTARTRWGRALRWAGVALYAAFLPFSTYHEAYLHTFFRDPAVVDDWRLLLKLGHFLSDAHHGWWYAAIGLASYLAAVGLAVWTFRRVQEAARPMALRTRAIAALIYALVGGASLAIWRMPPANAVVQPLTDSVRVNWQGSRAALASRHAIFDFPIDYRYDGFSTAPMPRRPNVYFLLIEAYGEILATCSTREAYRDLLSRMQTKLEADGFRMRSGYSTAPVHGGRSWISMATVHSGIRVDAEPAYRLLEQTAKQIPTLTRFFKSHGYQTLALQPGDWKRIGLTTEDIYARDHSVIGNDIPYKGIHFGLSSIPDQYSLGFFEETAVAPSPQPRFAFYMATSTHYWWVDVPPFVRDWKRLDLRPIEAGDVVPWAPVAGRSAMPSGLFSQYFDDIEYEWRALAEFIEKRRDEDALIVVVGDHQPLLTCGKDPITFNTPIHVLSRDQSLLDRFADVGLEPGLFAEPGSHPPLRHQGLFSLLASHLTSGGSAQYFPDGVGPSGLRR